MPRFVFRAALSAAVLSATLFGARASADGGFFVETTATSSQQEAVEAGLLSSSGQRAVLWLHEDGCHDLYVDPGTVAVEGAAWVLPLPAVPEVSEASDGFLDELDAATAPLLVTSTTTVTTTYTSYSGCDDGGGSWALGCGVMSADGEGRAPDEAYENTDEGSEASSPEVTVLGEGRLGPTAYEIVSTATPEALETWLGEHGYAAPAGIAEAVEPYVRDGWVFYVARVDRRPGDPTRLAAPRFTLCDSEVVYPLRLSVLSAGSRFLFTLWIVSEPGLGPVAPTDRLEGMGAFFEAHVESWDGPPESLPDFETLYIDRLDDITTWSSERALAVQLSATLDEESVRARSAAVAPTGYFLPSSPALWTDELRALTSGGRQVLRLYGALRADQMQDDVEVTETYEGRVGRDTGLYLRHVTIRQQDWAYSDGCPGEDEEDDVEPVFGGPSCAVTPAVRARARGLAGLALGLLAVGLAVSRLRRG